MYFKALVHDRKGDSYKRRIHNLTSAYKKCNDIEWKSTEAVPRKKPSCFQQIYMVWKIKLQQCRHMLNWEMVTTAVLIMQKVRVTEMALLMTISLMNMIWYEMIWYHWLSILRISVLIILLMNSRSISIWGNRPGSSSATGRRECECFSRMEDQNEVENISDTVATNTGYLFIRNKETKDVRNRAFFSIDSVIPWIASWKLKVKLTVSFSQTCLDRNMLIPRKSRRLVFELIVRRDLLYWSRLKRKEIIQQLHIYDTKGT